MRKIIVGAQVSMDGVMQAPGGPTEDPTKGFKFGGWAMPYFNQEFGEEIDRLFSEKFDLLLGRKTYEIFAAYWPYQDEDAPHGGIAKLFNDIKKYAVSRSGEVDTSWAGSVLLRDIADVKRLKHEDGPNLVTQGSDDAAHPDANGPDTVGPNSMLVRGSPGGEVLERPFLRRRIEAEYRATLQDFLRDEVLEGRHLDRLIGELVGKMRRQHDDAFAIADDHVAREYRRVAAADRNVDVDGLVDRQIGRRGRTMVIGRNGELRDLLGVAKAAVRDDARDAALHQPGDEGRACGCGARILPAVDDHDAA